MAEKTPLERFESETRLPGRKKTREAVMRFFREGPVCTKFICTTCGGLRHLGERMDDWLAVYGISRVSALREIDPAEITQIPQWEQILYGAMSQIPEQIMDTIILPAWSDQWGQNAEFDRFLIKQLNNQKFLTSSAGRHWIKKVLFWPLSEEKDIFLAEAGDWFPEELRGTRDLYLAAAITDRQKKHEEKQADFEQWKEEHPQEYQSMLKEIEKGKRDQEARKEIDRKRRQAEQAREQARQKEKAKAARKWVEKLNQMEPMVRLNALLEAEGVDWKDVQPDWLSLPPEIINKMSSTEISRLIHRINDKIYRVEGSSGKENWKSLRRQLYDLRQEVMKREFQERKKD